MLDLAVVNGTLYDGSGGAPAAMDVGVKDGRVVAVVPPGALPEAARTVDATDRIVTPGFVDPHTHMDAQLWWEPSGAPSVLHGVTSVVMGSCGFGVAPIRPGTEEYVLRSLESVEEIPYDATRVGVPMTWASWPDFFEQVGRLPLGVNVAGFVPHSALRAAVMDADRRHEPADPAERQAMVAALHDALSAGAIGMSSSRGPNHTDAAGDPVPSRAATTDELAELVAVCQGRIWQINLRAKADSTDAGIAAALAELEDYLGWTRDGGCRLTWTPLVATPGDTRAWRRLLDYSTEHAAEMSPQVSAQAISAPIRFDGASQAALIDGWAIPFAGYGSLDDDARRTRLADPAFREALRASPENCARSTGPCFSRWRVASSPTTPDAVGLTLRELGDGAGRHPVDALLDLALADDLATVVDAPLSNVDDDAVRALVTSPTTVFGIGDAGAHVTSISNYSYPTHVLSVLARDRDWLSITDAVHRLTAQPAEVFGLVGRGTVAEGAPGDLCVIDLDRLSVGPAELVADLPGGARRLHRAATGYDAVVVNGALTVQHDQLTDERSGELLRA